MRAAMAGLMLAATLSGCQKPGRWDSTDPVHCFTVFGLGSAGAAASANTAVVNDLNSRMVGIAQANGGVEWMEQIKPESQRFAAEIEAAKDEPAVRKLFHECAARHAPDR